jgi:uncharacterized protein
MLKLSLGRLKHQSGTQMVVELTETCDPKAYDYQNLRLHGPVTFQGQAENQGELIQLNGVITAKLDMNCSRCGKELLLPLNLPFAELYTWLTESIDEDGEQDLHHFEGDNIDLTPEVLRLIFWDLPMKPLCQADCRGLCLHCGVDLNLNNCTCAEEQIDPRWEKLQKLLQDQSLKGV